MLRRSYGMCGSELRTLLQKMVEPSGLPRLVGAECQHQVPADC
jgi:hypothetical protein